MIRISEGKVLPGSCKTFSVGFSSNNKPFIAGVEAGKEPLKH